MATDARLSQLIAEVLRTGTAVPAQLSQVVVEVLRINSAETPIPPPEGGRQPVICIVS